ncbi:hypothetical protein AVEN_133819-1 [Araneus ventricosus]|uniref:Uncharacterized protein n=1 Tax=Araneus ventricosus TaxID=182803 RepID=A0A4Y2QZH4_ARAVE|nr:hypothetical protein AVEN_133819-1 [Araneus ventricosus]
MEFEDDDSGDEVGQSGISFNLACWEKTLITNPLPQQKPYNPNDMEFWTKVCIYLFESELSFIVFRRSYTTSDPSENDYTIIDPTCPPPDLEEMWKKLREGSEWACPYEATLLRMCVMWSLSIRSLICNNKTEQKIRPYDFRISYHLSSNITTGYTLIILLFAASNTTSAPARMRAANAMKTVTK